MVRIMERYGQTKMENMRGISSNGRALALHARGTGIDTRILQGNLFINSTLFQIHLSCRMYVFTNHFYRLDQTDKICRFGPAQKYIKIIEENVYQSAYIAR